MHAEDISAYHSPGTLHTELDAEGTRGKGAEARRQDPKRDECAGEENEDAKIRMSTKPWHEDEEQHEYVHDRQATADVLTDPSSNSASSIGATFNMRNRNLNLQ